MCVTGCELKCVKLCVSIGREAWGSRPTPASQGQAGGHQATRGSLSGRWPVHPPFYSQACDSPVISLVRTLW